MAESSTDPVDGGCGGETRCVLLHVQRLTVRRWSLWYSWLHLQRTAFCRSVLMHM